MNWTLPFLGKISKIGIRPPRPEAGRAGLAITLIVRNEAVHAREWAAFHAAAGASAFFVYDNGCSDATIPILRDTLGPLLTVVPWNQVLSDARLGREIHNQVLAYAHAASNFGGAFRWMTFIDLDEFLIPKAAATLPEALAPLGNAATCRCPGICSDATAMRCPRRAGCCATICAAPPIR